MAKKKKAEEKIVLGNPQKAVDTNKDVTVLRMNIHDVAEKADEIEVNDDDVQKTASSLRNTIKEMQKEWKKLLEAIVGPAKKYTKKVRDAFNLFKAELDDADAVVEEKMVAYHEDQKKKAREAQEVIEQENLKRMEGGKTPLPVPVASTPGPVRTGEGMTTFANVWTFEIIDPDKVPREYCSPDPTKIRLAVQQGIRKIGGTRIFEETQTSRR